MTASEAEATDLVSEKGRLVADQPYSWPEVMGTSALSRGGRSMEHICSIV